MCVRAAPERASPDALRQPLGAATAPTRPGSQKSVSVNGHGVTQRAAARTMQVRRLRRLGGRQGARLSRLRRLWYTRRNMRSSMTLLRVCANLHGTWAASALLRIP
jgi:hypothetical protein